MPADPPGKGARRPVRIGKYEVVKHIATGGMGAVYKAIDTALKREVALKVLPPEMAARPAMLERFRREARSAAKLRHDNIVAIYEFGEEAGTFFLALEFVDGVDLHEFISRKGKLDPELARRILMQAVRALDHAHGQNIVHRDIKPSNFLIAQKGGDVLVKLTDLGLAREVSADEFRVTRDGTTVGTVDYMSPEQARDSAAADIRSDIYSLGCTLYHMLAGTAPFPEGSLTERIYKHVESDPPDVRRFNPDVPADLMAILRRMLEKKPADRYQTPQELLDDLENPGGLVGTPVLEELARDAAEAPAIPMPPPSTAARLRSLTPRSGEAVRPVKPKSEARLKPKPASKSRPVRQRTRAEDEENEKPAKRARKGKGQGALLPPWWPWAACAGGLVVAVIVVFTILSSGGDPEPDPVAEVPKKRVPNPRPKPVVKEEEPVKKEDPVPPKVPVLYQPAGPDEVARLRQAFEGPLASLPAPLAGAATFHVSRVAPPGPNSFRSLTDACAAAPPGRTTILEIHDNGPLFEPSVPAVAGRNLVLRAGGGHRPLLAWDVVGGTASPLLALEGGSLTLENLDVVVKWSDERADRPAVLFDVTGGNFSARDCTFSVSGKHPHGVKVVRLEGKGGPAQCRLGRCYVRGTDLTALTLEGTGADALLDGCLIVGGEQPLVDVTAADGPAFTVRLVRSTLVADKNLLRVRAPGGKDGSPTVKCLAWDALLAHPGAEGDLLRVTGGAAITNIGWRAVNCVYAGWERLLASAGKEIPTAGIDLWRTLWAYSGGDKAMIQPWPRLRLTTSLEESGPLPYDPTGTPVHFAANSGAGPVGADLSVLPGGRPGWLVVTYERFVVPPLALLGDERVPPIPRANDGRYHGGSIVLSKPFDLGQFLAAQAQQRGLGPRVVLYLSGAGEHATGPIRLRGTHLVLYFKPAEGKARPLTLVPNPATAGDREALIELEGGSLEMIGARIAFENSALSAMPARVLKVQGQLRLFNCRLEGPLGKTPAGYRELIHFAGSGKDGPAEANGCAINQCVLLSGKTVLRVQGTGARLHMQQCAVVAVDDALHFDVGPQPGPRLNVQCSLEHNTLAVRGSALRVEDAPKLPGTVEPIVVHAEGNLFLDPFGEAPRRSALLRFEGDAVGRGLLLWRGKGNGYDVKRLHAYVAPAGAEGEGQAYPVWARVWGKAGEQQPALLDWPATPTSAFSADRPQLERLRVPPQLEAAVGADLVRLGILKKK